MLCTLCLLASCVDADYDLRQDIDWSIGVGGEYLTVPFGSTEAIPLDRILKTENSGMLQTDAQGNYRLLKQESFSWEVPPVDPVTIQVSPHVFDPIRLDFSSEPIGGAASAENVRLSATVDAVAVEPIDTSLPEQVQEIDWMTFRQPVYAALSIRVSGATGGVDQLQLEHLKVSFPEYVRLVETGTSVITINDVFSASTGYTRLIEIERMAFEQNPVAKGALRLSVPIRLDGTVVLSELASGTSAPEGVILEPVVTLSEMPVGLVQGRFQPQVEASQQRVDLTDIPDFLQGDEVVFDVEPRVALDVENTLGMVLDVNWVATPWRGESLLEEGVNEVNFTVDAAEVPGDATLSRRWLATSEQNIPAGYRYVEAFQLPRLVKKIPEYIDFQFKVEPDALQPQQLDLGVGRYSLEGTYELNIPLSFGPSLQLCYRDTIRNLIEELGEVTDKVSSLEIVSEATNTIPLELQCRAIPMDVHFQPLEGVEVSSPEKIQAGGANGEAATSSFGVTIRETVPGALALLDALILEVNGSGQESVAHIPLNVSQYLQFTLTCKVPGGLHLDLDDL